MYRRVRARRRISLLVRSVQRMQTQTYHILQKFSSSIRSYVVVMPQRCCVEYLCCYHDVLWRVLPANMSHRLALLPSGQATPRGVGVGGAEQAGKPEAWSGKDLKLLI